MVSGMEDGLCMRNGPGDLPAEALRVGYPAGVSTSGLAVRVTRSTREARR
jgi:hypothetical protein